MADKTKDRLLSNLIISIGSLLVILTALIFVGLDAKNIAGEVLISRSELNAKLNKLGRLEQLREEAKLAEPKFELLENILPNRDDLFTFTEKIEGLGARQGVDTKFTFGNESDGRIDYNISVIGDYGEIVNYLQTIKEMSFMSVFGIDVIRIDEGYRAGINGELFFNE